MCFFNPQWPIKFLSDPKTDTKVQSVKLLILKTDWGLGSHVSVLHVDKQILYTIFLDWHHLEDLTKKQLKTNIIFTRAEMVMASQSKEMSIRLDIYSKKRKLLIPIYQRTAEENNQVSD